MRYEDVPTLETWTRDSAVFATPRSTGRVAAITNAFQAQNLPPAQRVHQAQMAASAAPGARVGLDRIDAQVETYQKAFSPMAKLNVLNDLRREINAWHQAHPGVLPMAMAALEEMVDRRLKSRAGAARYSDAICIAYHTGCNYEAATGITHGAATAGLNTDYFRHSDDDEADMVHKCADLWAGIEAAKTGISNRGLVDNNQTLKIFMAPEFYFRGRNGAYPIEVVSAIIPKMMSLGTAKPIFQDWLFVFGTAVASFEASITYCQVCPWAGATTVKFERNMAGATLADRAKTIAKCTVDAAHAVTTGWFGAEVQNVALIQHGSDTHLVAKEYVSPIDYKKNVGGQSVVGNTTSSTVGGVTTTRIDEMAVLPSLGGHARPGTMAVQNDERLGGCIFTMDGLTFGLEVCLDHWKANNATGAGRVATQAANIHILLIPSYGMSIGNAGNQGIYTKADGIAFNVDGRRQGNSEVKLNAGAYGPQAPIVVSNRISLYGPFNVPA
jgi:hypothetical protein